MTNEGLYHFISFCRTFGFMIFITLNTFFYTCLDYKPNITLERKGIEISQQKKICVHLLTSYDETSVLF